MRGAQICKLVVCLGVLYIGTSGEAQAGITNFNNGTALRYAREVGGNNAAYILPSTGMTITRTMNVLRGPGAGFLVDIILSGGAVWNDTNNFGATNALTLPAGYGPAPSIVNSPAKTKVITYLVKPSSMPAEFPTLTFTCGRYNVLDVANMIGTGKTILLTIQTRDAATGALFDVGTDSVKLMTGAYAIQVEKALSAGKSIIDISSGRTVFVGGVIDDNSPNITINGSVSGVFDRNSVQFQLTPSDHIDFVISGNLTGIVAFQWGDAFQEVSAIDLAAGTCVLRITGDNPNILNAINASFVVSVSGVTMLAPRTLTITTNLKLISYPANNRSLATATPLTTWNLNGEVLTANWVNGNNSVLNSRVYLWNPSDAPSDLSIEVYTLPNGPSGSRLLGTLLWGTLPAFSGANIKIAEDILTPIGVRLPYTDDGGNLVLVITASATGVFGMAQTFPTGFVSATYALRESFPK